MLSIGAEGPTTQQAKQGKREERHQREKNREKQNNNKRNKQNTEKETLNTSRSWLRCSLYNVHRIFNSKGILAYAIKQPAGASNGLNQNSHMLFESII